MTTSDAAAGEAQAPVTAAGTAAARLRRHLSDPLNTNVYALTLNTVASSLFGIGYWVLAARLYPASELGIGSAMVTTMMFLSNLSQLNLNGTLARFLPAAGKQGSRLIATAYGMSCLVAIVISVVFLVIAPVISERLAFLGRSPWLALTFVVCVAAWGVFTLQDSVLTALRGALWIPIENTAFGTAKMALLVLMAGALPSLGIFLSWNIAVLVALVPVNILVFRRLVPRLNSSRLMPALPARRALARFVALDYVGYLFMQAGTNALPLIVIARLGAEANGVFYISWLLGGSLELVAYHFGTSLTVESAADEGRLPVYSRKVLWRGLLTFTPAVVLICLFARQLLTLFGAQYAHVGPTTMRLVAISVLPKLLVIVYVAACRLQRKIGRIIMVQATMSTLVVSLSLATVGHLGITGIGIAYLCGQLVMAGVIASPLIRLLRTAP